MKLAKSTPIIMAITSILFALSACGSPAKAPKATLPVAVAGTIEISQPRVRLPASGQTQTAAYLTLTNTGTQRDRLISAASPQAKQLELHAHTKTANGMMKMRRLDYIEVPQGASIPLVPGGLHLMVKHIKPDIKIGDRVDIDLKFASGSSASFKLPVVANPRAQSQGDHPSQQRHQH